MKHWITGLTSIPLLIWYIPMLPLLWGGFVSPAFEFSKEINQVFWFGGWQLGWEVTSGSGFDPPAIGNFDSLEVYFIVVIPFFGTLSWFVICLAFVSLINHLRRYFRGKPDIRDSQTIE